MGARDSLETDSRVVDAPDAPRETPETEKAEESPRGEVLDDPDRRREESAELRQRVEGDWIPHPFKVPRAELASFDLKRAGLPKRPTEGASPVERIPRNSTPQREG